MNSLPCVLLWSVLTSGVPAAAAAPPASPTPAPASAAALPEPTLPAVPGWLGFATLAPGVEEPREYWTPKHPSAQAVLFSEDWKAVPKGMKVTVLSAGGARPGTYVDTSSQHFGCEQNQQTFAGFQTQGPLPEGPVWILPGESTEGVAALPVKEVPAESLGLAPPKGKKLKGKDVRAFDAGGMGFLLTKTGRNKGLLTVVLQGKRAATLPLEKARMEGSDNTPFNLFGDELGVAIPVGAFQLGASGAVVVVLGVRSYEGHSFRFVVRRGDSVTFDKDAAEYLYFCAF